MAGTCKLLQPTVKFANLRCPWRRPPDAHAAAAKRDDTKDFWDVIRKEQRLLDLLSVIIARANADIIRNLPARGRYAPSSPSEPPSASSSPQYEVDDDDDRKENYSPQWEASSPGYD